MLDSGLGPLSLQGLLLQLPDNPVQAGPAGASDRDFAPAGSAHRQLQLQLQGLLIQAGELRPVGLEDDFGLAQLFPALQQLYFTLGGLPLSLETQPVGLAILFLGQAIRSLMRPISTFLIRF